YLVRGLESANVLVVFDAVEALKKSPAKPKLDDAAPFRSALLAGNKLQTNQRWKAVELLRHWSGGRKFGYDDGDWKEELGAWARCSGRPSPTPPSLPARVLASRFLRSTATRSCWSS